MMIVIRFALIIAALFVFFLNQNIAYGDERHHSYLCSTDIVVGFKFDEDKKDWRQAEFKNGTSYVIKKTQQNDFGNNPEWEVYIVDEEGEEFLFSQCAKDFGEYKILDCSILDEQFVFSRESLRFWLAQSGSALSSTQSIERRLSEHLKNGYSDMAYSMPYMAIGRCGPI